MNLQHFIKGIDERRFKFREIPGKMRTAIVGYLKCAGMLTEELSAKLDVPVSTIYYHWRRYQYAMADEIKRSSSAFIGRMLGKAEQLYKAAKAEKDFGVCWKIETDLMDRLIKLGMIDHVPEKIDLTVQSTAEEMQRELSEDISLLERLKARGAKTIIESREGNESDGNGNGHGSDLERS